MTALPPSRRPPTSHDVARAAGVSQPTVSRALRDDARVAAETRRRVREVAERLGYVTSRRGRSLSTRTTGHVAVVVADLANPFYLEAIEWIHAALHSVDRRMLVITDAEGEPALEQLLDGSIDGAVLTTMRIDSDVPRRLVARGLPIVLFNRAVEPFAADTCVSANVDGGRRVAVTMVAAGHTRIAAIFGPEDTSTGRDREVGFRAALADAGVELDPDLARRGPFAHEAGHRSFAELVSRPDPPTAVFCANDVVAIGALNAAAAIGIAVPEDMTIFGFDDISMASWDVFRLSTVRQDLEGMALAAVRMLLKRIADPSRPPRTVTVPVDIVLRASHGPAASDFGA